VTDFEVLVIGAGAIGAAIAHHFSRNHEVVVLEREARAGSGMSSRNSGVIHAGIYYPNESLKTRLCQRGKQLLYAFLKEHDLPHLNCGKYIVARGTQEVAFLKQLQDENPQVPLETCDVPQHVRADAALFSPTTGILDQHQLIEALLKQSSAQVLYHQDVQAVASNGDDVRLQANDEWVSAKLVINAAGLWADRFLPSMPHHLAQGAYVALSIPTSMELPHLVYPAVPKKAASLGVHLTRNLAGEAFLGPDLRMIEREHYGVPESLVPQFLAAAKSYLPWLEEAHLRPGYAGIRAKLQRQGFADFTFVMEAGVVHCMGIESPGLTACMAIAEYLYQHPFTALRLNF
jgi:L-2-hydroxyglutarate oxidase LhgO